MINFDILSYAKLYCCNLLSIFNTYFIFNTILSICTHIKMLTRKTNNTTTIKVIYKMCVSEMKRRFNNGNYSRSLLTKRRKRNSIYLMDA